MLTRQSPAYTRICMYLRAVRCWLEIEVDFNGNNSRSSNSYWIFECVVLYSGGVNVGGVRSGFRQPCESDNHLRIYKASDCGCGFDHPCMSYSTQTENIHEGVALPVAHAPRPRPRQSSHTLAHNLTHTFSPTSTVHTIAGVMDEIIVSTA